MIDMSKWADLDLDVISDLHLDPRNVRLESASNAVEADIMADLFANEHALSLVEGIAKVGYLSHETPIGVKRDGKYVVVEGNRRVAALKAIQNPHLVAEYTSQVTALGKLVNKSALKKIRVKVAPNQDQADELIATLHTSNARRAWGPARQAAFFQAQIDAGRTYKQLVTRYPLIDVRKFVFRSRILALLKKVKYTDPAHKDYFNSTKGKKGLSTLARIYESKEFLNMTGLVMDDKGALSKSISDGTFNKIATVIVTGMAADALNTRSLNSVKSPRFGHLMKELGALCELDKGSPLYAPPAPGSGGGGGTGPSGGPSGKPGPKPGPTVRSHLPATHHLRSLSKCAF